MGYEDHEISVVITTNEEIMKLNKKFRGIEKPTNVLSFPMLEGEFNSISPKLLGDIVISSEKAMQEAEEAGISFDERMSQLLVHGILHLIGFDHEKGEQDAAVMEKKSLELLRFIENNPNLDAF